MRPGCARSRTKRSNDGAHPVNSKEKIMARLTGKVALIVGGGADGPAKAGDKLSIGNGRATAIACAREGASVMVADRSLGLAQQTAAGIRDEGGRADAGAADGGVEAHR